MNFHGLVANIRAVDQGAKGSAARSIDRVLTLRNWLIGAYVVEYEQNGEDRATYGDRMIPELAKRLRKDGFVEDLVSPILRIVDSSLLLGPASKFARRCLAFLLHYFRETKFGITIQLRRLRRRMAVRFARRRLAN